MWDRYTPDRYFDFHKKLMLAFGARTLDKTDRYYNASLFYVRSQTILLVSYFIMEIGFVIAWEDRTSALYTSGVGLLHWIAITGAALLRHYQDRMNNIFDMIEKKPFGISEEIIERNRFQASKYSLILSVCYIGFLNVDIGGKFLKSLASNLLFSEGDEYTTPYYCWMPFAMTDTKSFVVTLVWRIYGPLHLAEQATVVSLTFYAMVLHCIYRVRAVQEQLYTLTTNRQDRILRQDEEKEHKMTFVNCIIELNHIMSINGEIEGMYGRQLFNKFFCGGIIFTSYMEQMLFSDSSTNPAPLLAICAEPLVSCYLCETLTLEFQEVVNSMYNLNWDEYSPSLRKEITFAMMRMQEPVYIMVNGLFPNNLETYTSFMSKCYSVFTLLTQTQ